METTIKMISAVGGAIISFLTGIPAMTWVLLGVMTLDYATGLICGFAGKSSKTTGGHLSSRAAFDGLMRKCMILLVVLLSVLVDIAVQASAGAEFTAVTGAVCMWFIASEGVSILENAAAMGLPVPKALARMLEAMQDSHTQETE